MAIDVTFKFLKIVCSEEGRNQEESSTVQAPKAGRVVFGTSQERETFPEHVPFNRFAVNCASITGVPHIGPGTYENEEKTNFTSVNKRKIQSTLGYSLAARTAKRFGEQRTEKTPCPTHYQQHHADPVKFRPDTKPFLIGVSRFKNRLKECEFSPSPNTYNVDTSRNQKVVQHQSFGGAPILMPDITIKSTIEKNTNKLYTTTEEQKYHQKLAYLKLYW